MEGDRSRQYSLSPYYAPFEVPLDVGSNGFDCNAGPVWIGDFDWDYYGGNAMEPLHKHPGIASGDIWHGGGSLVHDDQLPHSGLKGGFTTRYILGLARRQSVRRNPK